MCQDQKILKPPHLEKQYEFFTKHLEYHDSNILKILSIYYIFVGVFLARIDNFYCAELTATVLVTIVGLVVAMILHRTSRLLDEFKDRINDIDKAIDSKAKKSISNYYRGFGVHWWQRTSIIGVLFVVVLTFVLVLLLITVDKPSACNHPNEEQRV